MGQAAGFTGLDWLVLGLYVVGLAVAGILATRKINQNAQDYFLASRAVPPWLVAISVLSTMQSAATFLGAPDSAYRGNFTYLSANIGAILGALLVSQFLIGRFYAAGVSTAYEWLEQRYGKNARNGAAAIYLIGRILASGARLYLAAIAVSMIIYNDIDPRHLFIAASILVVLGLAFTAIGGLNAIIWSDVVQVGLYLGAAILVLAFLFAMIPSDLGTIITGLAHDGAEDKNKFLLLDFHFGLENSFSFWAIITGITLLNAANFGLDQDTTQRLISCENVADGRRALIGTTLITIPVVAIFMLIGSLLYVVYQRPDLMGGHVLPATAQSFSGTNITIFMHFILTQLPAGLKGLVCVGVIAAAAVNSGLISMCGVLVQDFYRPLRQTWASDGKMAMATEAHFVNVGRWGMVVLGLALLGMSSLCYYWQNYADTPLLDFVLGVMGFAYGGLIGVYSAAIFTKRGNEISVLAAFATGFFTTLLFQAFFVDAMGLPHWMGKIAFPWVLCLASLASFLVCAAGRPKPAPPKQA